MKRTSKRRRTRQPADRTTQTWIATFTQGSDGVHVYAARPLRRKTPWVVPAYVRQYLLLEEGTTRSELTAEQLAEMEPDDDILQVTRRGAITWVTFRLKVPERERPRPRIPKRVPAIRSLADLCAFFHADTPRSLNRRLYKDTECGASISVLPKDAEQWLHNGQDGWDTVTEIDAFTIQTIVEGSDAEVNSAPFYLPCTQAEVDTWIAEMEAQADVLWKEANDGDENERDEHEGSEP